MGGLDLFGSLLPPHLELNLLRFKPTLLQTVAPQRPRQ